MLALRMGRTIGELMETMSSQEFSIWIELFEEDQWGEAREDFRFGMVAATIANYAGKVRSDKAPQACAADFMPTLRTVPVEPVEPDPVMFFKAVAASKTFNK